MANESVINIPPIEMPKLKGLGSTYFDKMLQNKHLIAQTDVLTNKKETYGTVLQKTIRTAIAMSSKGIKPNDIITICSHNTMDSYIPYYASLFIGAISANLDPKLPKSDIIYLLNLVRPKLVFVVPEALKLIEDALRETNNDAIIVIFGGTSTHTQFSEFLLPSPKEDNFVPYEVKNLKDTAVIVFTSGTTGMPKGACLNHYGLLAHLYQTKGNNYPSSLIVLSYGNLYWITAITLTNAIIINGMNRLICSHFDPKGVWNIIREFKVVGAHLSLFYLSDALKEGPPAEKDISSLQFMFYGGGGVTFDRAKYFTKCFPNSVVVNGYGQTECWSSVFGFPINDIELFKKIPHSIGKPITGCCYKVVDPETEKILGPNQEGELRIKSDFFMNGYYGMDSKDAWDSEGFVKTGDIVYYDEDQCFFYVTRIKDTLKYQTLHISPPRFEAIIATHPAVHDCVITGVPHEIDGDHLMALVVLKESYVDKVTEEEVQQFFDDQVAPQHKLRAGLRFVKEFPLTVTNKIDRRKINALALGELV